MTPQGTPFDPTRVPHLGGRFAPVTEEADATELRITGTLPDSLDGVYLRNGPNPRFTPVGSYPYPIDGDGMIHGLWLSQGRARYRNRFVRTPRHARRGAGRTRPLGRPPVPDHPRRRPGGEALAGSFKYVQWPALSLGHGPEPAPAGPGAHSGLTRALVDPATGTVRRTQLDDTRVELPRIDDRSNHRLATAAGSGRTPGLITGEYDALCWYDIEGDRATSTLWPAGDLSVGEPVFAPTPGTRDAADGHWLTFATDRTDDTSWLLVLPGDDPAQGPVARVRIPVRVPLGLHGTWLPTEE
ncbi:carotenoid oxygenase family protein [Streptomyces albidoflavus]